MRQSEHAMTHAEQMILESERRRVFTLHQERTALEFAAGEFTLARRNAEQAMRNAGVSEQLENRLDQTNRQALQTVQQLIAAGRNEVSLWEKYAHHESDVLRVTRSSLEEVERN